MIDFKEFKKVKDEKDHAILKHPKGHEIKIAKKALSGKLRNQLDKLPHFAEGTEAPIDPNQYPSVGMGAAGSAGQSIDDSGADADAKPFLFDMASNAFKGVQDAGQSGQLSGNLASSPQPSQGLASQQQEQGDQDLYGHQKELNQVQGGLSGESNALNKRGELEAQQGEAVASTKSNQAWNLQDLADSTQKTIADLTDEHQRFMQDIANTYIDPTRYLGNMSTTGKISTAIGLLLGGIGGGLTGQENPALKFINQQIDRDIEAQKANLGTKKTLLEANMHQFGNVRDSAMMTRIQMNDITSAEIGAQEAKYGGKINQQNSQLAKNQLQMQSAELMQRLGMNVTLMKGAGQGKEIPDAIDSQMGNNFFRLNGIKHYAKDADTAKKATEQSEAIEGLENATRDINQFNKQVGTTYNPLGQNAGKAEALNSAKKAAIARVEASGGSIGRLANQFDTVMPTAGAFLQDKQKGKSEGVDNLIREAKSSLLDTHALQGPNPIGGKRK